MKLLSILLIFSCSITSAQLPQVSAGSIKRFENFSSTFVSPRNVDVWLPEGYDPQNKYAVLYMQDGQMLFDSTSTWNKQEWRVDETVSRLIKEQKIIPCIVVAVWNSVAGRHADYFPQKPFESLPQTEQDSIYFSKKTNGTVLFNGLRIHSDGYLKFLVKELKPFIDRTFSTLKDQYNTFIVGSSMGGLISMYAICEYPKTFGGAACLSTHWPGIFTTDNNPIPDAFFQYLKTHLPDPSTHKIYFDYGDQTLDALYPPLQQKADAIIKAKGFTSKNWVTEFYPGEAHSERAWSKRLPAPLLFLLGKR